jgi:hypothetical protein
MTVTTPTSAKRAGVAVHQLQYYPGGERSHHERKVIGHVDQANTARSSGEQHLERRVAGEPDPDVACSPRWLHPSVSPVLS